MGTLLWLLFIPIRLLARVFRGPPMVYLPSDHPEMEKAIAAARATLPEFRRRLAATEPGTGNFAVKARFPATGGGHEHCWVSDLTVSAEGFAGKMSVNPQRVAGLQLGSPVEVTDEMITDWGYSRGDEYQGHFTTKVLLPHLSSGMRRQVEAAYGWCSPNSPHPER